MQLEYRIGNHTFDSVAEYEKAQQDYEYTQRFIKEIDLKDPQKAKRLYEQLKQSKHLMKSPVGDGFQDKLVEVFVHDLVKKKKEAMQQEVHGSFLELLHRAKEDTAFFIYWSLFQALSILQILYYSCILIQYVFQFSKGKVMETLLSSIVQSGKQNSAYIIVFTMVCSLLLLGKTLCEQNKKSIRTHRMNLTLMSGAVLCLYLLIGELI